MTGDVGEKLCMAHAPGGAKGLSKYNYKSNIFRTPRFFCDCALQSENTILVLGGVVSVCNSGFPRRYQPNCKALGAIQWVGYR